MATRARGPGLFRKRIPRRSKDEKSEDNEKVDAANTKSQGNPPKVATHSPKRNENESASLGSGENGNSEEEGIGSKQSSEERSARRVKKDETPPSPSPARGRGKDAGTKGEKVEKEKKPGVLQRVRDRSRSRSRSRKDGKGLSESTRKDMLVAVTSCRSDGYYNQKAPGSISKLPRQAPKNLKLFHELAVGVKDAYAAVGETPVKPDPDDKKNNMGAEEIEATNALWEFIGNLDFLLALVDEVSVDTVTRGALKQDDTFKGLRDVIKKCNRVLEDMLVRRERKYTLFFRLVQPHDSNEIDRIIAWNEKVEKAVGSVTGRAAMADASESDGDAESTTSNSSDGGSVGSRVFSRGRQLLPTAGKVRSRRATPTPRMRRRRGGGDGAGSESDESAAGDDGYSATVSTPMSLNPMGAVALPNGLALRGNSSQTLNNEAMMAPKDELVDVIRGLRVEKMKNDEGSQESNLQDLKPNWLRKADIPSSVPKLPTEYVHRHRQMKQVVSCLLDQNFAGSRDDQTEIMNTKMITSVTSRHSDKAGNGKTTLAVAAIQTVEVRERFPDGIAWLKLGDGPLSDKDIRRLYGELYKQLIVKEDDVDDLSDDNSDSQSLEREEMRAGAENPQWAGARDHLVDRADSIRRFQAGDLEGIKEDLGRMLVRRKVLICLDDVARVEDARRFIFDVPAMMDEQYRREKPDEDPSPYRILMTTRTPSLMGAGIVQEVFVRILSEHEAVKLFLSTTGRRPYGGRNSKVFNQARMIVKGCGNSPLAIRLVGSVLRMGNRNWSLKSPIWMSLINQCTMNLEEASILRSFVHAFMRIVDLSFFTINDLKLRILLRRCFVWFAMAFRDNDWMLSGKGIPRSVVLRLFETVQASGQDSRSSKTTPASILAMLEKMNLVQRAGHGVSEGRKTVEDDNSEKSDVSDWSDDDEIRKPQIQQYFIMLGSLKLVAEKMAARKSFSFCPEDDQFMYFSEKVAQEIEANARQSPPKWREQLHFLIRAPSPESDDDNEKSDEGITDEEANELVVVALLGAGDGEALLKNSSVEAVKASQLPAQQLSGGDKLEEYMMSFITDHLMKARAFSNAAELLSDQSFLRRRVFALGIMEATNKEVADMLELRRLVGKYVAATDNRRSPALGAGKNAQNKRSVKNQHEESGDPAAIEFDIDSVAVDGSRFLIDEIYRVTNSMGSSDSLGMATCLAAVGEGLLKCRQPRDAMLRLEEAVSLYRGILGPYHVYVAHALHQVAKALVKLGETRVALLKFAEAARIYEACNAILHYDSIQNAQSLASLLVDIGEMDRAESMFEEVIAMKMSVYGEHSVPVAKTINSYAILLAKHGRTNQAMANYEAAKATYERSPPPMIYDAEFEIRCSYDITLITLNIASIWSKKGDLQRALACYEEGVVGLQKFDEAMLDLHEGKELPEAGKSSSHKHIVSALGRIGSIKLKLRDEAGALDAYLRLLEEVKDDSPLASHTEKAKAYIKCATIYRQKDDADSRGKSIEHLREAFRMYKAIFGPEHKDSVAIKTTLDQWLNEEENQ